MNINGTRATLSTAILGAAAVLVQPAFAHAQMRDSSARMMIRQAMEDYSANDIDGALSRLRLTLHGCDRNRCSASVVARLHVAIGTILAAGQDDADGAVHEFSEALAVDSSVRPDPSRATPAVNRAFERAGGGTRLASSESGDSAASNSAPGQDNEHPPDVRASGDSPDPTPTHRATADTEPSAASSSESESTVAPHEQSRTYTFAAEIGGGIGAAYLMQGIPEYEEYREWDFKGSGNFNCGPPNADGSDSLVCPAITQAGFSIAGIVSANVRVNFLPRVGIGAFVRYQPQSASVGILPSVFFGGRMYLALNSSGFVRRGPSVALFAGTGVGQMQATPPVASGQPAHIISGLNNVHLGLRVEYGFGVAHAAIELSQNVQFPNVLLVTDAQAFVGVHF